MFKLIFMAFTLILCFFAEIPGGSPNLANDQAVKNESEITGVIKGAIEDTNWLYVSSRPEMERVLGAYYTGPLLSEYVESAWNFVSKPTGWESVIKAKSCEIISISDDEAVACADILERDAVTGDMFISKAEYFLIKTEGGWRIVEYRLLN